MLRLAQGTEGLPVGAEVLWGGLLSFCEAPRSFWEVLWGSVDAVAGQRGALGCDFLARGGIPGRDFFARRGVPNCTLCNGGTFFLTFVAFDAGNALLFSGACKIRYQKGPSPVPNMRAVLKKAS